MTDWLQAIGTLGALWFAVVQVTRDGRATRRRDRAHLIAAHKAIHTVLATLTGIHEQFRAAPLRQSAWSLSQLSLFETMEAQLDAIPLQDLPDGDAIEVVMSARVVLRSAARDAARARDGEPSTPDFIGSTIKRLVPYEHLMAAAVARADDRWWRRAWLHLRSRSPAWQ